MTTSLSEMPTRTRLSYACFSAALFIALGSYQFISPVKQALFFDLVGTSQEPLAKSLVLAVLVPVLLCYSLLFSYLGDAKRLMLFVGGFFSMMYLFTAVMLLTTRGHPGAWLAWVLYYITECRGVILMPLIWSIVNDVTSSEVAKVTYPLIFFVTQVGGIAGSFVAVHVGSLGGTVGLILIQVVLIFAIVALTWFGCTLLNAEEDPDPERVPLTAGRPYMPATPAGTAPSPGGLRKEKAAANVLWEAFEGLWLLLSRPYAFMTFWVSYATLVPRTSLDYTNGVLVRQAYPGRDQQLWGHMGLVQNCSTAALSLLGTKAIVEMLGVGNALMVLPVTLMCCVTAVCIDHSLFVSVCAVVTASVLAYGLNSPCKEMLYIRTSREIKYKAKSWSEMYGNELMKLFGAQLNLWVNRETASCRPHCFHNYSTLGIVVVWVAVWLAVVVHLGREHAQLEASKQVV
eukprot:CAMPEP_0175633402 /NCGR_PEP_ID=MMETSP0097-20121207/628_1 /TAXON_ID=311494 /ORGANISM="Alexandrium monilatum, Strain CCMP3105" /LENGTH=457 /DNA_ID=CAMNT_0016938949 /DNA_START=36 /DNA_END=1406 /DNA_ORIENTATION=+